MKFVLLNGIDGRSIFVSARHIIIAATLRDGSIKIMLDDETVLIAASAQIGNETFTSAEALIKNLMNE